MKQSICLAMIVKNEAHVICRCLESVLPVVDCVVIHDTGSTDNTLGMLYRIRDAHQGMDFRIVRRQWKDFAYNRNELLNDCLDTGAGYVLTLDADEELIHNNEKILRLSHDLYNFPVEYSGTYYVRPGLFLNDGSFRYKGVVHEYIFREDLTFTQAVASWGWHIKVYHEGARSKDPLTYLNDAKLLVKELKTLNPGSYDHARTLYYIAQSYKDSGDNRTARDYYCQRARLTTGWFEERWHAQMQAARLGHEIAGLDLDNTLWEFLLAYQLNPARAEPLYYAATLLGTHYALKEMLLRTALNIKLPEQGLFLEPQVYKFLIPLELSVACWYLNKRKEGLHITQRLLLRPDLPDNLKETLEANLKFYGGSTT